MVLVLRYVCLRGSIISKVSLVSFLMGNKNRSRKASKRGTPSKPDLDVGQLASVRERASTVSCESYGYGEGVSSIPAPVILSSIGAGYLW